MMTGMEPVQKEREMQQHHQKVFLNSFPSILLLSDETTSIKMERPLSSQLLFLSERQTKR